MRDVYPHVCGGCGGDIPPGQQYMMLGPYLMSYHQGCIPPPPTEKASDLPVVQNAGLSVSGAEVTTLTGKIPIAVQVALTRKQAIEALAQRAQSDIFEIGRLLYEAYEAGDWTVLNYERWQDYIEDLGLPCSYSQAMQLKGAYEFLVVKGRFTAAELEQIGVSKAIISLAAIRSGQDAREVMEQAKVLSERDLRQMLYGEAPERHPEPMECPRCGEPVRCSKCGETIPRWVRKEKP